MDDLSKQRADVFFRYMRGDLDVRTAVAELRKLLPGPPFMFAFVKTDDAAKQAKMDALQKALRGEPDSPAA